MNEYATFMAEAKMWGIVAWSSAAVAVLFFSWAIVLVLKLRRVNKAIEQNEECIGRLEDYIRKGQ